MTPHEPPSPLNAAVESQNESSECFLSVAETAALLRVGVGAIYGAVREGTIPHLKIGRKIRIPRHALLEHAARVKH